MKNKIILVLIVITSGLNFNFINAQDTILQPKNAIYVGVGSFGLWFTASGSYERQVFFTNKKVNATYYVRASGGAYSTWGSDGPYGSLSLQGVYGAKKSHLELGLGWTGLYDKSGYRIGVSNANFFNEPTPSKFKYTDWYPTANVGYRFQKPKGGFVFRTGVGFPEGVYLSFGWAF